MDRAVRQSVVAIAARDLVREHGADRAVAVADRHVDRHLLAPLERGLRKLGQPVVQGFFSPWFWRSLLCRPTSAGISGIRQIFDKSRPFAFQCSIPYF